MTRRPCRALVDREYRMRLSVAGNQVSSASYLPSQDPLYFLLDTHHCPGQGSCPRSRIGLKPAKQCIFLHLETLSWASWPGRVRPCSSKHTPG